MLYHEIMSDNEVSGFSRLKRKVFRVLLEEVLVQEASEKVKTRCSESRTVYATTSWGLLLSRGYCKDIHHKDGKYFRRRFRVPYSLFERIVTICRQYNWFPESHRSAPLELKILATLRKLGRGGCFDNLYDSCGIDEETLRVFYHKFCRHFSEALYTTYVHPPTTQEEISKVTEVYKRLGFPGAIGSVDCTHIRWDKCPAHLRATCKGKEGFPSLAYELTVDHFRRIHAVTEGHYGTRNDKTIVKYDAHVMAVKNGLYAQVPYHLYNAAGVLVQHVGLWLITDGGYHRWSCMACPMKHAHDIQHTTWSCSLESVRKDVECVNGALKSRFRDLKNPIELHKKEYIDNVIFTCCILHNILIEYDGFDRQWEEGVDWEAVDPDAELDEEYDMLAIQDERARHRVVVEQQPDLIVGPLDNLEAEIEPNFFTLRANLITHYVQARSKGEVEWLG